MTVASDRHVVVVDGSNLATEGRTTPSLRQLDEAVRAYAAEDPGAEIVVVVDASFEHRIDPSERKQLIDAELHGEVVSPPAGAIGRGDAFVLRIAERTGAIVLSNDSFQEFHAEHPWLFDRGRLVGGKPVTGVGWIFTPRIPVRGPKSRQAQGKAKGDEVGALSPPVKAAELAKAAKKVAARRAPVLPDGSTPKVGDVWPVGAPSTAGSAEAAAKKAKKAVPKVAVPKDAKAKGEKGATKKGAPVPAAGGAPPKKAAVKKVAKPAAKKALPHKQAGEETPPKKAAERAKKTVAAKKEPAKKAATEKEPAKKAAAKKAVPDKEAAKKAVAAKKVVAGKREPAKKAAPQEVVVEEEPAKKAAAKTAPEPATKKAAAKEALARRAVAQKAATKKAAAKKEALQNAAPVAAGQAARKKTTLSPVTTNGAAEARAARSTAAKNPVVQEAIGRALAEAIAPAPDPADGREGRTDQKRAKRKGKEGHHRRRRPASSPPAVNEPLAFITFVATYPLEHELEGEVVSFTSHGAMVDVDLPGGGVLHSYIPLTAMGDPPPSKARQVLKRGERRRFVLMALDPPRRVAELALAELVAGRAAVER